MNESPTVSIGAPADGVAVQENAVVRLLGSASDPEDGNITSKIDWTSDREGSLGFGGQLDVVLQPGEHRITASVEDAQGASASASITLEVKANSPPTVNVERPLDGATLSASAPVEFQGTAEDAEDGDLTAAIRWSSDVEGKLGEGGSISKSLSTGTHIVTASVTDAGGSDASTWISLTVLAGSPPTVDVASPEDGIEVVEGTPLSFEAMAQDTEDGVITSSIEWDSDRDGLLGTGGSVTATLSSGDHQITASVVDSDGMSGSASLTVTVVSDEPPVLTVNEPADGLVVTEGEAVELVATATDAEDGDLTSAIEWTSDRDGALAVGGSISVTLSLGGHTITASVSDSREQEARASRRVEVEAALAPGIFFSSDRENEFFRHLYRTSIDGASVSCVLCDTPLGDLSDPAGWPGPGGEIAFVAKENRTTNIYAIRPGETEPRPISTVNALEDDPAWGPGGLLFWTRRDDLLNDIITPPEIRWVSESGAESQSFITLSSQQGGGSALSPDGRWFAFHDGVQSSLDLQVFLVDTSTLDVFLPALGGGTNTDASFAPDGRSMAFVSTRNGNSEIYIADLSPDGTVSSVRRLTNHPDVDTEPSWSPDGSLIAFRSNRDGNNEIYVIAPDGTGLRNVTNAPAYDDRHPAWEPN